MIIGSTIITIIRVTIIFLIIYAIIKNLKLLLIIAIIIFAFLTLQSYLGYNASDIINQVIGNVTIPGNLSLPF